MDVLSDYKLLNKTGQLITAEDVMDKIKVIVFYFEGDWCDSPDSREVLTQLKKIYAESRYRNLGIEVVYVSSDTTINHFDSSFETQGDWFAVPFDHELADHLRRVYEVSHIPNVIVVKKTGEIVTKFGRKEILENGLNVLVAWT